MKTFHIITVVLVIFLVNIGYSQSLSVNKAEKLTKDLNTSLVDSIHLSLNTDEGLLVFGNISKRLDLRHKAEIARDSMSEKEIKTAFYNCGKFEREDLLPIHRYYTKTLRGILKREFQKFFDGISLYHNSKTGSKVIDLKQSVIINN